MPNKKPKTKIKHKRKTMDEIHEKLMEKKGWYHFWHNKNGHQAIQWVILVLVVVTAGVITVAEIKPAWLDNLKGRADLSTELIRFPNDKIAFIIGPQLKSGSPLNPHPWFDRVASERGHFWGEAFPKVPPMRLSGTVSLTNGSTVVTGTGTRFLSEISIETLGTSNPYFNSNRLTVPSGSAEIASVQSDTQLTLKTPWSQPTVNGMTAETNYPGNYDQYLFGNYYDQALIQYTNYYRTGDSRYLNYARKIADSYWKLPFSKEGQERRFDTTSLPPRHASLGGLMLRAMDGRPEMWDWINAYARYHFDVWLKRQVNNSELYYGVREGAYALLYATELAKVLPDSYPLTAGGTATNGAALRAQYLADAENVAVNYYGRLQYPDGSWRWSSPLEDYVDKVATCLPASVPAGATSLTVAPLPFPIQAGQKVDFEGRGVTRTRAAAAAGSTTLLVEPLQAAQDIGRDLWIDDGALVNITQPFQVGLLIQSLGDLYTLTTNATVKDNLRNQITKAVGNLHTGGPYRSGPAGYQNYHWRGYHYAYYGGTTFNPNKYVNGSDGAVPDHDPCTSGFQDPIGYIQNGRAAIQTILHSYGVAYVISGDPKYRTWGDEVFAAGYGQPGEDIYSDGIRNYANTPGEPKSYNEAFRTGGRYLAYRLIGSGGTPPDENPPSTGDTTAPTVSLAAPNVGSELTGSVTLSATASDNGGIVSKVEFYRGATLITTDTSSPYSLPWDTSSVDNGSYTLLAKAYDPSNNVGSSNPVSVTVSNSTAGGSDTTRPVTTLISPNNNAVLSGTVTLTATASDNVGVTRVYFSIDENARGSDTTDPYSFNLDTTQLTDGTYTLQSVAWDAGGNQGLSAPVTFTVNNSTQPTADTTKPSVTSFDVQPRTGTGAVTVSFRVADSGGSHLKTAEIYRAVYSTNCNESNRTACSWSLIKTLNAPSGADSWTGSTTDSPSANTYLYGMHVVDNAGNRGVESAPIKVAISSTTTPPTTPPGGSLQIGDRVTVTTRKLNIRSKPGSGRIGSHPLGDQGTIIGGPASVLGYVWWNVDFDTGPDGWAAEDFLAK